MNPLIIDLIVAERSEEIRRDVQHLHLIAQYRAHRESSRPPMRVRFRIALGNLLIRMGQRLNPCHAGEMGLAAGEGP